MTFEFKDPDHMAEADVLLLLNFFVKRQKGRRVKRVFEFKMFLDNKNVATRSVRSVQRPNKVTKQLAAKGSAEASDEDETSDESGTDEESDEELDLNVSASGESGEEDGTGPEVGRNRRLAPSAMQKATTAGKQPAASYRKAPIVSSGSKQNTNSGTLPNKPSATKVPAASATKPKKVIPTTRPPASSGNHPTASSSKLHHASSSRNAAALGPMDYADNPVDYTGHEDDFALDGYRADDYQEVQMGPISAATLSTTSHQKASSSSHTHKPFPTTNAAPPENTLITLDIPPLHYPYPSPSSVPATLEDRVAFLQTLCIIPCYQELIRFYKKRMEETVSVRGSTDITCLHRISGCSTANRKPSGR